MDEGLIAYGTSDPWGPYDPSAEIVGQDGGALSQVGSFFGNLLTTVTQQLPGMIMDEIDPATGQPMPVYRTQAPTSPLGGMMPLLLIGGVALFLLTSKRR